VEEKNRQQKGEGWMNSPDTVPPTKERSLFEYPGPFSDSMRGFENLSRIPHQMSNSLTTYSKAFTARK
jgi:hypothetical protein